MMDPNEVDRQMDEELRRTEEYNLTFQQDAMHLLERLGEDGQRRAKADAARTLHRAQAAYARARAFLDKQQQQHQQSAEGAEEAEEGAGEGEEEAESARSALRWLARAVKAVAELLQAGFDKLFVEVADFAATVGREHAHVQESLVAQAEEHAVARVVSRASRPLARVEAAAAKAGAGAAAAHSAAERLQTDVDLLREAHPHNATAAAFVARAEAALSALQQHHQQHQQQRARPRQHDAELRRIREAAAAVRAEADAAQRELQAAVAAAERSAASAADSALDLSSFERYRRPQQQ